MRKDLLTILEHEYGCRDLGPLTECLGTEIDYDKRAGKLKQSQRKYIEESCKRFAIDRTNTTPARSDLVLDSPTDDDALCKADQHKYMQMVGCLNYIANGTRPDISAITSVLGQFMQVAGREHFKAARRVFEYLKGTAGQCLTFRRGCATPNRFHIACDASHGDRGVTGNGWRRSRSGIVIMMNGAAISWISRSQTCVAISTAEAEYIALCLAAQEQNWLREIVQFLGHEQTEPTVVYEDNDAARLIAENDLSVKRSKSIDIRYHYVRERVADGQIRIERIDTKDQPADLLTKNLPRDKFEHCRRIVMGGDETF